MSYECITFKMVQMYRKIILELLIRLHARDNCRCMYVSVPAARTERFSDNQLLSEVGSAPVSDAPLPLG